MCAYAPFKVKRILKGTFVTKKKGVRKDKHEFGEKNGI